MPKNTLVINCDIRETRVALIEEGVIAELQIERAAARGTVGNIVLGKVTRVLPGLSTRRGSDPAGRLRGLPVGWSPPRRRRELQG
jgi:hypothetical protein